MIVKMITDHDTGRDIIKYDLDINVFSHPVLTVYTSDGRQLFRENLAQIILKKLEIESTQLFRQNLAQIILKN